MTLVYLLAGEQSGDVLGGRLMAALRAADPSLRFAGVGGPRMEAEGLAPLFPMRELAVMGLVEILPRIRRLSRLLREAERDIRARRPDVLVTIDSPGFNLRLLKRLRGAGLKRVHYVAPQVWAWREHRVREFPGLWDSLMCLLPFEVAFFAGHGVPAEFVGHPVLESGADRGDAARFRERHGIAPDAPGAGAHARQPLHRGRTAHAGVRTGVYAAPLAPAGRGRGGAGRVGGGGRRAATFADLADAAHRRDRARRQARRLCSGLGGADQIGDVHA